MKKFVIGDIHGNYDALKIVLQKSNFDFDNDMLISLGDIVDRGEQTKECIDLLMKIKNFILCRGNHDDWALNYYLKNEDYYNFPDDKNYETWKYYGGQETIDSLGDRDEIDQKYIDFLKSSKLYHIEDNKLFVHAGLSLDIDDVSKQHPYFLIWEKSFIRDAINYNMTSDALPI
jgi:serine/threonine protein phosphatase 1